MPHLLSVVVTTYNRSESLLKTLRFLQGRSVRVPIIVADGSDEAHRQKNLECSRLGPNISYFYLPQESSEKPSENYRRRMDVSLDRVTTPYMAFCADDDLLSVENALASAKFLERNPGYIACHGQYLQFRYVQDAIHVEGVAYDGASIDGEEIGVRLMQLFSHYEAPFYAVFRTPIQRRLFDRNRDISPPLWDEIYHSTAAIIDGKIRRDNNIYCLRNVGNPPHHQPIENFHQWAAKDFDGLFVHYRRYRDRVIEWISDRVELHADRDKLYRAIDMAFMTYVVREFDLSWWVNEYLMMGVVSEEARAGLRARMNGNLVRHNKVIETSTADVIKKIAKSVVGKRGIDLILRVRGNVDAPIVVFDKTQQPKSERETAGDAQTKQRNDVSVAPWLKKRFPQEQWNLFG